MFKQNIVLIGFMGVGKSSVSKILSDIFKKDCFEVDDIITQETGMSIIDIFETYGEEYFRTLETQAIKSLIGKSGIVSCGGGIILKDENIEIMQKLGRVVLLTASAITIYERLKNNFARPLLSKKFNLEHIENMLKIRKNKYEIAADFIINTDNKTPETVVSQIINALE
ncbi:MAG: shikimate kinase [Defluviitaleaceae bacterium]|nr:shikimate kinase [Defluviitaleaceae bacterium]